MEKLKMKVVDIEEHPTPNGLVQLKVIVKSGGKIFTFAAKEEDYLDELTRKSFHQNWLKQIKKVFAREHESGTEVKRRKNKMKDLKGAEVEEVEY
jgi:hypothetical protein